jgi:hypothetical protein
VYILLLMYNSSFMCYLGNTVEMKIKICPFFETMFLQ